MTTVLSAPIAEFSPSMLEAVQAQYPNATLRVEVEGPSMDKMDEDKFWAIVGLLDWEQSTNPAILQPAMDALSKFPKKDICQFQTLLYEKLYALDAQRFAVHLGSNAWPPDEGHRFSVDDFLYARCGVVANGRAFYEAVLADPTLVPKEFTFETLLYLPERAWELQGGAGDLDCFPELSCETFSNAAGWPTVKPLAERLKLRKR